MQVDAQEVINNLGMELANKSVENATLKAQIKALQAEVSAEKGKGKEGE